MKIIIIGATGLIGQRLVGHLEQNEAYKIVIVSRRAAKSWRMFPNQKDFPEWDGKDEKSIGEIIDGAGAVINLAGESIAGGRWTDKRKQRILDSRVESTSALVNAINKAEKKPSVMLQASAIGYYGASADKTFDERSPAGKGFLSTVTESWEAAAKDLDKRVRLALLRTGVVLDKHGGALEQMQKPFKFGVGGHIGSGKQWFSWIHIEDEVRAIAFLLENEKASGAYNLTAPEPVTMKVFAKSLGKAMKRPSWLHAPSFAIKLMMGEMGKEMLLSGQRVIPKRLLDQGFTFNYNKAETALQQIYGNK